MIVRWKLELAGSRDSVSGSLDIDDDAPDDEIDDKVTEDALHFIQVTWRKEPEDAE
jgi:hypothetical protein